MMETTIERMTGADGAAVLMRFFGAAESGDMETARSFVADDFVMEWPQSGERFTGPDNAFAAMGAAEVKPQPAGEPSIVGGGDTWVLRMPLDYAGTVHHYVGVFDVRDGLIRRATEYFGAPFPAQPGRAKYADPPARG
jgi:hypothetical protein